MNKQTIKFAHLSDTGMLYSHSMLEKEWLQKQGTEILDQMKSEKKEENVRLWGYLPTGRDNIAIANFGLLLGFWKIGKDEIHQQFIPQQV